MFILHHLCSCIRIQLIWNLKIWQPLSCISLSPRFLHRTAQVRHKTYLWGGRTEDFISTGRKTIPLEIETFDTCSETWTNKMWASPPGLCSGGFAVVAETLYYFGGISGNSFCSSLHSLNTETLKWEELQSKNPADQPMPKSGHGIVTYHDETVGVTSIAVFAGYGKPVTPIQPGSTFIQNTNYTTGWGWTNELHLFNLTNGMWVSLCCPPVYSSSFTHL